jgi:hypothetical protein
MHSTDTKSKFLEFRGKGWSLARIAKQIDVSVRTLADWNQQHRQEIRTLRAIEIEALQEKFLATHEQELSSLTAQLQRIEQAIADSKLQFVETKDLFRLVRSSLVTFGHVRSSLVIFGHVHPSALTLNQRCNLIKAVACFAPFAPFARNPYRLNSVKNW